MSLRTRLVCAAAVAALGAATVTTAAEAAPGAGGSCSAPGYTVTEAFYSGVYRINHATAAVSAPSLPAEKHSAIAITPDARTAYATQGNTVTPIDIATGAAGARITVAGAKVVAISPDGTQAFVGGSAGVIPVQLPIGSTSAPIAVTTPSIASIAFRPNGNVAYVLGWDAAVTTSYLTPIRVATGVAQPAIALGDYVGPALRISPDGSSAFVASVTKPLVYKVNLGTGAVSVAATLPGLYDRALGLTLAPDGATLYVGTYDTVFPIAVATGAVGSGIALPAGFRVADMAVTPDGCTLYVSHSHADQLVNPPAGVLPVNLASGTVGSEIVTDASQIARAGGALAITPDQAPVAKAKATMACSGSASFDASNSSVRYGSITQYAWDFGDGVQLTTTSPLVTHQYASATQAYSASVVETDSAGTSRAATTSFTGQTMSRNGGPSAFRAVTVGPC